MFEDLSVGPWCGCGEICCLVIFRFCFIYLQSNRNLCRALLMLESCRNTCRDDSGKPLPARMEIPKTDWKQYISQSASGIMREQFLNRS
jgi:hypothetical protein